MLVSSVPAGRWQGGTPAGAGSGGRHPSPALGSLSKRNPSQTQLGEGVARRYLAPGLAAAGRAACAAHGRAVGTRRGARSAPCPALQLRARERSASRLLELLQGPPRAVNTRAEAALQKTTSPAGRAEPGGIPGARLITRVGMARGGRSPLRSSAPQGTCSSKLGWRDTATRLSPQRTAGPPGQLRGLNSSVSGPHVPPPPREEAVTRF